MIKECLSIGKKVLVPFSDTKNRILILSELNSWEDLTPGSYGILEPKEEKIIQPSSDKIDLIIVPGVGFDEDGRRIGHGKGYYDDLLKYSKDTISIGLAFEIQILDKIPTEKHDIAVNKIITEKRLIDCDINH
jgi:5-formyltetrahydrofolate cyclo-ligase